MNTKEINASTILEAFYRRPIARVTTELILTLGFTLFLGLFAIQPTLVTMTKLTEEIKQKRTLDEQLTRKVAALASAQVEYFKVQDRLLLLDQAFPTKIDIVNLAKILEKTAGDSSVIIQSLSIGKIPADLPENVNLTKLSPQELKITVTIEGSYTAIRNYAENLRKNRVTILVDSVIFSLRNNRGKQRLTASLNLSIPYYGQPEANANTQ